MLVINSTIGSYKMELNRELRQHSRLEVIHCVQDDSFGSCIDALCKQLHYMYGCECRSLGSQSAFAKRDTQESVFFG